jgi:hypothetical protein
VIDTIGIKIGPFAMIDVYGTPYPEALHVVERYRLIEKEVRKIGAESRINEPGLAGHVFTMPWSATKTYRRPLVTEWQEVICAENPHEYYAGKDTEVPRAEKPDF